MNVATVGHTFGSPGQSAGTFELTGFGRFTRFDDTLRIQEELGGGGSLGFYLLPILALEAEGAYTKTHSNVTGLAISNVPLRGRLSLHIPIGGYASGIRVGAGYVRNLYRKSASFDDNGVTGIFGFRFGLSPSYGFRIDGTADYVRSPEGGRADDYINWGAQVGLSLLIGSSSGGVKDKDQDGTGDKLDQCPNTPVGKAVDAAGCPVQRDSDADGIRDGLDLCPNTPKGETVNDNGCTILFQKQARTVILRGVNFQTGKATLTPEARDVLRDIAAQLVENPQYRVQISGHTDNTGSRAVNLRLSIARARTVETFLEANGVPRTQVTSKGFGPAVPVASNKTAAGRAQNRRVELHRTN